MATVNAYTFLQDPSGEFVSLAPGEEVPAWAVAQVGEHLLDKPAVEDKPKRTSAAKAD